MLKRYSLFTVLCAVYACSTYSSAHDAANRFISNMARKLHFSGLVSGTTYQYKIMRNSMHRALEIIDGPEYKYYGTSSIFPFPIKDASPYSAETWVGYNGHHEEYIVAIDFNTFTRFLQFYNSLPTQEVLDPDYYVPTYFKSGTFTYVAPVLNK